MVDWIINILHIWCDFIYYTITSPISTLSIAQVFGLLSSGFVVYLVISTIKDLKEQHSEKNDF